MSKYKLLITLFFSFALSVFLHTNDVFAEDNGNAEGTEGWGWPVHGIITDTFGARGGSHYGIDIAAPKGTEIKVVANGTVVRSYYSGSYGNVIFVMHPNGYETVYAHMSKRLAKKGDHLKKGMVIGAVGNTGHSRGNHLHFEVHDGKWDARKSMAVNPLDILRTDENQVTVDAEIESSQRATDPAVVFVKAGDTLWDLSKTYEVTIDELKKWNDLNSDLIVIGQKLVVTDPVYMKTAKIRKSEQVSKKKTSDPSNMEKQVASQSMNGADGGMDMGEQERSEGVSISKKVAFGRENPLPLIVDIHS